MISSQVLLRKPTFFVESKFTRLVEEVDLALHHTLLPGIASCIVSQADQQPGIMIPESSRGDAFSPS